MVRVAMYPLNALPARVAISVLVPSEKTLSELFVTGFWPFDA
jgi:hypothetical protein